MAASRNEANFFTVTNGNANVSLKDSSVIVLAGHGTVDGTADQTGKETRETVKRTDTVFNPRAGGHNFQRLVLSGRYVKRFRKITSVVSWDRTAVKKTYKDLNNPEPGFDVYPQMRKGIRFYEGEYAKEEGFSITSPSNSGELITFSELVEEISEGESRIIAVVGQAGSGKTTIMKRIARSIMEANKLYKRFKTAGGLFATSFQSSKRRFQLVYYANIKDLSTSTTSIPDLLFGKSEDQDKNSLSYGYDWILQNEGQVVFLLDGLDQAPWDFVGTDEKMSSWDVMSTGTIIHNLISGNILNGVKVVISSREHRIATLPEELRPHLMVSLAGLRRDDVQKLFIAVMGDGGKNEWDAMCKTSPVLVRLSSVPLFLIFNAIVRKHCQLHKIDPPDSTTGIMCHLLAILSTSKHTQDAENIIEVMRKLRPMAYQGMKEKRVTFTQKDLQRHGLQMVEVQDLIIKVPGSSMLPQNIIEADCTFFFAHQCIHEFLAAEHCVLMAISKFKEFLDEFCHEDRWSVVRKFLCGILVNAQLRKHIKSEISNESDIAEKRDLFKKSLDRRLRETTDQLQFLELLGSLYEANDAELIKSHVTKISFNGVPLSPNAMHTISSIMRRCYHLSVFLLKNCGIDEELMNILETNTRNCKIQVEVMDFGSIEEQTSRVFVAVAKFATRCQVKEMRMHPWSVLQLGEDEIMELDECTVYGKVEILELGETGKHVFRLFITIASVAARCQAKVVRMKPWPVLKLSEDEVLELSKWTVCGKVEILDLGETGEQVFGLFFAIASVATHCQAKEVRMKPWPVLKLSEDKVLKLSKWTVCGKFKKLDLYDNRSLKPEGCKAVGVVVRQCGVENLEMRWCELTAEHITAFQKGIGDGKFKMLNVSWNDSLKPEGCKAVGGVVRQCGVEDLDMGRCGLTAEHITAFQKGIGDGKVTRLNITRVPWQDRGSNEFVDALINLLERCKVKNLIAYNYNFNENQRHHLHDAAENFGTELEL